MVPHESGLATEDDSIEFHPELAGTRRHTLRSTVVRSLVVCLLAGWVLAGCAPPGEPESKAVSQAQVVAQAMSTTPVTFITATSGPYTKLVSGTVNEGPNPEQTVWAVDFEGVFSLSCAQSATPTCPVNTTLRVVLDEATGVLVLSESPAPTS